MNVICRKIILLSTILGSLAFLLSGCTSQIPQPVPHQFSTQKKMQAAAHWNMLAKDVARQVKLSMDSAPLKKKPIHVEKSNSTAFARIFHDLLLSHIVKQGLTVSRHDQDAIVMRYQSAVLEHGDRFVHHPPIKYTAIGAGLNVARHVLDSSIDILDFGVGVGLAADGIRNFSTGDLSNKEVIISTSLCYYGRYLMHQSDIYYINEPDGWQYDNRLEKQDTGKLETHGKTYDVVN